MPRRITIVQGHPDSDAARLCRAIALRYVEGARAGGHEVRTIDVSSLEFPLVRKRDEFESGPVPPCILRAQADIRWAHHLVVIYPLWLGTLPALLKGFFEQTFRYGFAIDPGGKSRPPRRLLKGRSARIFVTMGMPAAAYRILFGAHGVKSLESSVLRLAGFSPIRTTLLGGVETAMPSRRNKWLAEARRLGERAQ